MHVTSAEPSRAASHCLRAEALYLRALRRIRDRVDPRDAPLRGLLDDMIESARHQERAATQADLPSTVACACRVPALAVDLGEGVLDRDVALYLAERLTSEMASFTWSVWEVAPGEWRDALRGAAELRENWLERLKKVLP